MHKQRTRGKKSNNIQTGDEKVLLQLVGETQPNLAKLIHVRLINPQFMIQSDLCHSSRNNRLNVMLSLRISGQFREDYKIAEYY